MDLSELSVSVLSEEGARLEIMHPKTGQPLEDADGTRMIILLAGADSKKVRDVRRKFTTHKLKGRGRIILTADELEEQAIEIMVAATLDWSGICLKGEVLECTPENCRKVYKGWPWIAEQVDEFINDRRNYLGNL